MTITWFGTASIEIKTERTSLLFDPFVPMKDSTVDVKLEDYDNHPFVFLTHGHLDHILSCPGISERNSNTVFYCTATPCKTLGFLGLKKQNLKQIKPGQTFEFEDLTVEVIKSRHAVLSIKAVNFRKVLKHLDCLPEIIKANRICRENRETVAYRLSDGKKTILLFGSMNTDPEVSYPENPDLLVLPYAGYANGLPAADTIMAKTKPRAVFLDHWDDTFPPLSGFDTEPFEKKYSSTFTVIKPSLKTAYSI